MRYYPGMKGQKNIRSWINGYVKPKGKWWKRKSNKKVRKNKEMQNGSWYKKTWGWFEWC